MTDAIISNALVIPVHNRRAMTLACLRRLRDLGDLAWATPIVVDDGSSDGTSEAVRAEFPATEIIRGTGSLFWTGAIAVGMQRALECKADFIFWLNDDCEPAPGALSALRTEVAQHGGAAGGVCVMRKIGVPVYGGFRKARVSLEFVTAQPGEKVHCDALNGNLVCLARAAVEACGLPDARGLPHALGDTDYTLRLRDRGFSVTLLGNSRAIAEPNRVENHASWLFGDITPARLWRNLGDVRSYAYLPAHWRFLRRHWGWQGAVHCGWLIVKRALATLLMLTVPVRWRRAWWGNRSTTWQQEKRIHESLRS